MHEADDAYSIRSTWSCYWLDQFLTLALNILILSIFTFQWICLPIILLILEGVELHLRVVVTILECCVTFSGVKLSTRSFVLFQHFIKPLNLQPLVQCLYIWGQYINQEKIKLQSIQVKLVIPAIIYFCNLRSYTN